MIKTRPLWDPDPLGIIPGFLIMQRGEKDFPQRSLVPIIPYTTSWRSLINVLMRLCKSLSMLFNIKILFVEHSATDVLKKVFFGRKILFDGGSVEWLIRRTPRYKPF